MKKGYCLSGLVASLRPEACVYTLSRVSNGFSLRGLPSPGCSSCCGGSVAGAAGRYVFVRPGHLVADRGAGYFTGWSTISDDRVCIRAVS